MSLNVATLTAQLTALFTSPPSDIAGCAAAWANAMEDYATAIVPASITVTLAASALESNLITTFADNGSPSMIALLEANFALFADGVALGMIGYTAVSPPGLVGFGTIGNQTSWGDAASAWVTKIDDWMRTGTATLIVFPFTVSNWS